MLYYQSSYVILSYFLLINPRPIPYPSPILDSFNRLISHPHSLLIYYPLAAGVA